MDWTIEFSADAERDIDLIFDHLFSSHVAFGDAPADAFDRAAERVRAVYDDAGRILLAPFRGTSRDDVLPGARSLTLNGAIYWFDVDEGAARVRVLAIFHGGQDHVRHMVERLST